MFKKQQIGYQADLLANHVIDQIVKITLYQSKKSLIYNLQLLIQPKMFSRLIKFQIEKNKVLIKKT